MTRAWAVPKKGFSILALTLFYAWASPAPPQWAKQIPPSRRSERPIAYPVEKITWKGRPSLLDPKHTVRFQGWNTSFSRDVTVYRYPITKTDSGHHCDRAGIDCESVVVQNLLASLEKRPDNDAMITLNYFSDDRSTVCKLHVYPTDEQPYDQTIPCPDAITIKLPPISRGKARPRKR